MISDGENKGAFDENLPSRNNTQRLKPLPRPKLPAPSTPNHIRAARNTIIALGFGLATRWCNNVVGAVGGGAAVVGVDFEGVGAVIGCVVAGAGEGLNCPY